MSIILVANTPRSAALIIPAIAELHPNDGPVISATSTCTAFSFPKSISYGEFPVIRNVESQPFLASHGFAPRRKTTPISVDELIEEVSQASTVYLFNPEHDGFRSHYHAKLMVRALNSDADIRIIEDHPFSPIMTKRAVETAAALDDYQPMLDAVVIAEHFEFNYRLNCYPLMTKLLARFGLSEWSYPGAGGLQLLLWLRSLEKGEGGHSFSSKELQIKARLWEGTGKFPVVDCGGRRISLSGANEPLDIHYDLVVRYFLEEKNDRLELTDAGRAVADQFPRHCFDIDQPFRVEAWKRKPIAEALPQIDAYLKEFFASHSEMTQANADEVFTRRMGDF